MANAQEKGGKPMSKTAFVKSLPADMPAKDVVDRAKKMGITLSDKYVYVVRSNLRRKGRGKKRGPGRPPRAGRPAAAAAASSTPGEREFRRLALQLGVQRAEQVLSDTKKKLQEIISG